LYKPKKACIASEAKRVVEAAGWMAAVLQPAREANEYMVEQLR